MTDNRTKPAQDQLITVRLLIAVMTITLSLLLVAAQLKGVLGNTGANVISRILCIILATIAVDACGWGDFG